MHTFSVTVSGCFTISGAIQGRVPRSELMPDTNVCRRCLVTAEAEDSTGGDDVGAT
jgi:hypothetical protein